MNGSVRSRGKLPGDDFLANPVIEAQAILTDKGVCGRIRAERAESGSNFLPLPNPPPRLTWFMGVSLREVSAAFREMPVFYDPIVSSAGVWLAEQAQSRFIQRHQGDGRT